MQEHNFPRNICGRYVTWDDVQMIRSLIQNNPDALRTELSRKVCLAWQSDGRKEVVMTKAWYLIFYRVSSSSLVSLNLVSIQSRFHRNFP